MKIAIMSDLHANKYATERVFRSMVSEQIDVILLAGDLVGYYYWGSEVIEACRHDPRVRCVRGNHEDYLQRALNDKNFLEQINGKYGSGLQHTIETMSREQLNWLCSLPREFKETYDGLSFFMRHTPDKCGLEYLYPDCDLTKLNSSYSDHDVTIFGHTHYPFIHSSNQSQLINPGSVGQPRDYGNLASYAIVNTQNRVVIFRRVPFEISGIIQASESKDSNMPYLWEVLKREYP